MALTEAQMEQLMLEFTKLDSGLGVVYFDGNIPKTHEEMNKYVLSSEGQEAAIKFTKAYRDNDNNLQDIENMAEFIAEYIHPAFDNRKLLKPGKARIVGKKLAREESKEHLLEASADNAIDLAAKKEAYEAAKKAGSDLWWKQRGEELSALGDSMNTFRIEAGVGASKAAAAMAGGFAQFGSDCQKLATHCYLMSRNVIEDTPETLAKLQATIIKGINDTLKSIGSFLHATKKALDPMRSINHVIQKEFPALKKAEFDRAEKDRLAIEDKMQEDKIKGLRRDGNHLGADLIERSGSPTVRAERKRIHDAEAAKLDANMKEIEAQNLKNMQAYEKFMAQDTLAAKRAAEHKAADDKASGVYKEVKDKVVGKLRSKSVSSASEAKATKGPDAPGRERAASTGHEIS
jgi:hypothetical protein